MKGRDEEDMVENTIDTKLFWMTTLERQTTYFLTNRKTLSCERLLPEHHFLAKVTRHSLSRSRRRLRSKIPELISVSTATTHTLLVDKTTGRNNSACLKSKRMASGQLEYTVFWTSLKYYANIDPTRGNLAVQGR